MSDIHSKSSHLYTIQDLADWKPPLYTRIIHSGVLNIKNRMLIFGDEGSWKSILAIHTAHSIARGSSWLGFRTSPCNVLRLQAELPLYIDRERTLKYCAGSESIYLTQNASTITPGLAERATSYSYPPTVVSRTEQFIHIDESSGWESLRQDIENCIVYLPTAPLVVILDPLFKIFNHDLNKEIDVKPMLDKIDLIMEDAKHTPGISFIIIHHTRKATTDERGLPVTMGSQDATGSRALVRWCDTVLRVDPDPKDRTLAKVQVTFTKHRNADDVLPTIALRWDRKTLHPQILYRTMPKEDGGDELMERGDLGLVQLE